LRVIGEKDLAITIRIVSAVDSFFGGQISVGNENDETSVSGYIADAGVESGARR